MNKWIDFKNNLSLRGYVAAYPLELGIIIKVASSVIYDEDAKKTQELLGSMV